ncbi:MAG: rRNA maturation RNase YbeY [Nitrospirota bacterium]
MKVYIKNQQRLIRINHQRIEGLLKKALRLLGLLNAELSILFVNDRRMRIMNRYYRNVDRPTDVLSFPQEDNPLLRPFGKNTPTPPFGKDTPLPPFSKGGRGGIIAKGKGGETARLQDVVLGDIVINLHKARRQAIEHCLTLNEELKRLLIHGLLHLTGYGHEKGGYDEEKMRRKERQLLARIS